MNKVLIQFQRELWESRASLVRTPVILAGVLMALLVVGIFTTQRHVQNIGAGAWMELKMDGDAVEFSELLFSGDLFQIHPNILTTGLARSEERRVGKECRSRWSRYGQRKSIVGRVSRGREQ